MAPANPSSNPLNASSLSRYMAASLPPQASPQLKGPVDAIALAVHAAMIAVGFRLLGLGEDHQIEASSDSQETQPLPEQWNASSAHAFRYAHPQSSLEFLIKVNRIGSKVVILGLAVEDEKVCQFDVNMKDFVSESSLPSSPLPTGPEAPENKEERIKTAQDILKGIFITPARLQDLATEFKASIIQKLAPGIHKEGYEEAPITSTGRRDRPQQDPDEPQPARPYPFHDPLAVPPRHPRGPLPEPIPGFEDEHEINRPPRFGPANPMGPFGGLGERDLHPPGLGPHDPLRPYLGGPAGGGMHPTFDDPLFRGQGDRQGYDPQVPPGSRYDPVGPGEEPRGRDAGGRFPGGGRFGGTGGRPPNPFGGFGDGDFI
ncbi:hypothetical protein P152DRAFT_392602 [Eremomyces bilateralis CBS 781.70]|uniref:Uncharacterized protein n=1 Tax=Eremomyces bilateralis CBS 781.70 TaxID=1392243 RepID=A0A6G1G865_9PEZI|nr:uncharacterized protein P152DRAFT_392602 [Eremomyces bilateralis CBS 781.70]KAF1814224.1 hypothetical protein P152DRAFT_392602 [Eremomyces bilateralis CBS 781.70]